MAVSATPQQGLHYGGLGASMPANRPLRGLSATGRPQNGTPLAAWKLWAMLERDGRLLLEAPGHAMLERDASWKLEAMLERDASSWKLHAMLERDASYWKLQAMLRVGRFFPEAPGYAQWDASRRVPRSRWKVLGGSARPPSSLAKVNSPSSKGEPAPLGGRLADLGEWERPSHRKRDRRDSRGNDGRLKRCMLVTPPPGCTV